MPIRKRKSATYSIVGPVWVITVLSGPYRWSLSHTMITANSGPYRPLFRTMSTAPSGPYRPLFRIVSTTPNIKQIISICKWFKNDKVHDMT